MWHGMNRSASDPSLIIAGSGYRRVLVVRRRRADLEQGPRRGAARLRDAGRAGRPGGPEPLVWRRRGAVPDRRQRRVALRRHLSLDRQGRALERRSTPSRPRTTSGCRAEIVCDPGTRGAGLTLYTTITRWDGSALVLRSTNRGATLGRALDHPGHGVGRQRQGAGQLALAPPEPVRGAVPLHAGRPLQVDGRGGDLDPHERRRRVAGRARWCGSTSTRRTATKSTASSTSRRRRGQRHLGDPRPLAHDQRRLGLDRRSPRRPASAPRRSTSASPTAAAGSRSGSRTLYLIGRGQQMQVSQNGGASWRRARVSPQPGRDEEWDKQISDSSTNGRPRRR